MTNQEILTKAIEKAQANGWRNLDTASFSGREGWPTITMWGDDYSPFEIIFNHDFAKALWGEYDQADVLSRRASVLDRVGDDYEETTSGHPWQAHLQLMVIADDPIKYLGEHL